MFASHAAAEPIIRRLLAVGVAAFCAATPAARAGERALVDTSKSPHAKMYMADLDAVKWTAGFWAERFATCRDTMVPHLWEIFSNDGASHAWANYRIAAGRQTGKFAGPPFNDGDFLKWLEALAQIFAVTREPKLDAQMDEIIAVIAKAQREDGYLHTQTIIPQRQGDPKVKEFADRDHFETYNMGHLMTAACVHHRATGKTTLLDCARKAADYIDRLCRTAPEDLARNAICPSHYMGVVELYRTTRDPRYLEIGKRLIEIRNLVPPDVGSDMNQDRLPFRQQLEAVGHAVRANYLYAGVADVFAESGDDTLLNTLAALADDVAGRKLYITGMTGALYDGASPDGASKHASIKTVHQAYGRAYQLPNLTAYNETCATVGYALWSWRMLTATGAARYADLFEQSLYNGVLPGISLEGKDYFYVNPLKKMADFKVPLRWSRTRQPNIKSSFCCPPNVVRMIAEAHNYAYSLSTDTLWIHLYGANTLDSAWMEGGRIRLTQETDYPWNGAVKFILAEAPARPVTLKLRVPGWLRAGAASLRVNDQAVDDPLTPGAYAEVKRVWRPGDLVEFDMKFEPTLWEANPLVEETAGQVAVKFGPLVYCVETQDLPVGVRVEDVMLSSTPDAPRFTPRREKIGQASVVALVAPSAARQKPRWQPGELYRESTRAASRPFELKLVPYFAWGNRGDSDMSVWLPAR